MDSTDDLTFRIIFSGDGAGRLRDRVKEKLKEFMGDYTDDTLVEYVIVLLKNGRRKEEARNELNVFLGDDSDSFVSWLWDHLRSNLHLYAQSRESRLDEVAKQKPQSRKEDGRSDLPHLDSEAVVVKSEKLPRSRRNKDWKGVIRDPDEPPPLRSAVIANVHSEDKSHQSGSHMKRSPSPQPIIQRKRGRSGERGRTDERGQPDERCQPDERAPVKRETVSKSTLGASRRLLQFAVRDAVATSKPTGLTSEPSLKRLRSVVSTPTGDSPLEEWHPKIRSVARVPKAMAVAIKAVEDAAKDVVKVKPSGNVFDRLGRCMDISDGTDQFIEDRDVADEVDGKHTGFTQITEATIPTYREQSDYSGQYVGDMLELDAGINSDVAYDTEGYTNRNALYRRVKVDPSQIGTSVGQLANDSMLHYNAANVVDGTASKPHRDQNTPVAVANSAPKIVNISSNVNTWKSPNYQERRGVSHMDNQKLAQENDLGAGNYGVQVIKDNSNPVTVSNGNGIPTIHAQREMQKALSSTGVYPTGRPTEDVDSRTIFVSNVHFAATKDSLSRHFNKFGDVLKVVIVTEAATGQPKGSAYVEFMRKEAAENALSLDGTSFMSRILKVVRKSSAHQEAAPVVPTWPRGRGSPFGASRFGRAPFPRGIPGLYRSRLPIKTGARSLQWKRDGQSSSSSESIPSPAPTTRSLTYVRTEAKMDGNFNNA